MKGVREEGIVFGAQEMAFAKVGDKRVGHTGSASGS